MRLIKSLIFVLSTSLFICTNVIAKSKQDISIHIISSENDAFPGTPVHLERPDNIGIAGAMLAIPEANQTGRFLGYNLSLTEISLEQMQDDFQIVLLNLNEEDAASALPTLLQNFPNTLFINARSQANNWRTAQCNDNLFHTAPSYAMQADALGQWLLQQRLQSILIVQGEHPSDQAYVDSMLRMAKRFKIKIESIKPWTGDFDLRRVAYKEIPQFTKTRKEYDAVFVADYQREFGYALPYNNYYQAPVIGDFGLKPLTWHFTIEQWGARQLQNRFKQTYSRPMEDLDFNAYLAVRTIAYAVQISKNKDVESLANAIRSQAFTLAAYKGRKLNFRPKNQQLRMPIALTHDAGLLTNAPLEGFLHPTTDLDTLGFDQNEICQ